MLCMLFHLNNNQEYMIDILFLMYMFYTLLFLLYNSNKLLHLQTIQNHIQCNIRHLVYTYYNVESLNIRHNLSCHLVSDSIHSHILNILHYIHHIDLLHNCHHILDMHFLINNHRHDTLYILMYSHNMN